MTAALDLPNSAAISPLSQLEHCPNNQSGECDRYTGPRTQHSPVDLRENVEHVYRVDAGIPNRSNRGTDAVRPESSGGLGRAPCCRALLSNKRPRRIPLVRITDWRRQRRASATSTGLLADPAPGPSRDNRRGGCGVAEDARSIRRPCLGFQGGITDKVTEVVVLGSLLYNPATTPLHDA